jgi:ADP-heptose:LPS heptosyltransferase
MFANLRGNARWIVSKPLWVLYEPRTLFASECLAPEKRSAWKASRRGLHTAVHLEPIAQPFREIAGPNHMKDATHGHEGFTYIYRRRPWIWFFSILDGFGGIFHHPRPGIPDLSGTRSMIVIKLDQIGDLILTQPLLAALRKAAPEASIELVVGMDRREVVERFTEVDLIHELPLRLRPGLPWFDVFRVLRWLRVSRSRGPEVAIAAKEEPLTVLLAWLLGARVRIGFREGGLGFLLTHTVPASAGKHQYQVLAALAGVAGEAAGPPVYPVADEDHAAALSILQSLSPPAHLPLVIIHPGAGDPSKQWPWNSFVETMRLVSRKTPAAFLIIGEEAEDVAVSEHFDLAVGSWVKRLSFSLKLSTFAALLAQADLLLGNDSAPAHLAAAVGTPSVVPFLTLADPHRWGPALADSRIILHEPDPESVATEVKGIIQRTWAGRSGEIGMTSLQFGKRSSDAAQDQPKGYG